MYVASGIILAYYYCIRNVPDYVHGNMQDARHGFGHIGLGSLCIAAWGNEAMTLRINMTFDKNK